LLVSVSLTLTIITMLVFTHVLYNDVINFMQEQVTDVHYTRLLQLSQRLNLTLSRLENLTTLAARNNQLLQNVNKLDEYKNVIHEKSVVYNEINAQLNTIKSIDNTIESILIVTNTEAICAGEDKPIELVLDDFADSQVVQALERKESNKAMLIHFSEGLLNESSYYFEPGSTFFVDGMYYDDKLCSLLFVKLSDELFSSILKDNALCAVILDGNILWQCPGFSIDNIYEVAEKVDGQTGLSYINLNSGDRGRIFYSSISKDYGYLLIKDDIQILDELNQMYKILLVSIIAGILITVLLSKWFAKSVILPITKLIRNVRSYQSIESSDSAGNSNISHLVNGRFSLRTKIMLYFILSVGVPLFLFISIFFGTSYSVIKDKMTEYRDDVISQYVEDISLYFERKILFSQDMGRNFELQHLFANDSIKEQNQELESLCNYYFSIWNQSEKLVFINREGDVIYDTTGTTLDFLTSLYNSYCDGKGGLKWIGLCYNDYNKPVYVIVNVIKNSLLLSGNQNKPLETIGYIATIIDEEQIAAIYQNLNYKFLSNLYVCQNDGLIVSCLNKNLLGDNIAASTGNESFLTQVVHGIRLTPLSIYFFCDDNKLNNSILEMLYPKVYSIIIVFLVLLLIFSELGYLLLKPMGRIQNKLKGFLVADIPELFKEHSIIAEVDELSHSFNEMQQRIHSLMNDLINARVRESRLEVAKKNAEINSLQSQIRPHFLCNILESLRSLIKMNRIDDSLKMISYIGDLFRNGISRHETMVTLEQEITYTKAYCEIMKLRFGDSISFIWMIDDEAKEYLVPKMILQPIIENSIEHGLTLKAGVGLIIVTAYLHDQHLLITVQDDGIGFDTSTIYPSIINEAKGSQHIGLSNIIERIRLYYGDKGIFRIESEVNMGTKVTIGIPIDE